MAPVDENAGSKASKRPRSALGEPLSPSKRSRPVKTVVKNATRKITDFFRLGHKTDSPATTKAPEDSDSDIEILDATQPGIRPSAKSGLCTDDKLVGLSDGSESESENESLLDITVPGDGLSEDAARARRLARAIKYAPIFERIVTERVVEAMEKHTKLQEIIDRALANGWDDRTFCLEVIRVWREVEGVEPIHDIPQAADVPAEALQGGRSCPRGWDPTPFIADGTLAENGVKTDELRARFYIRRGYAKNGIGDVYRKYLVSFPDDAAHAIKEVLLTDGH